MRRWLLLALLLAGCRTQPLSPSDLGVADLAVERIADLANPDLLRADDLARGCDAAMTTIGPPTPGAITCATSSCSSPQVCCLAGSSNMGSCQSGCPAGLSTFACDGPEDCNGGRCCFTTSNVPQSAKCSVSCGGATLCHATSDCPAGQECAVHAGVPSGSGVCALPVCH